MRIQLMSSPLNSLNVYVPEKNSLNITSHNLFFSIFLIYVAVEICNLGVQFHREYITKFNRISLIWIFIMPHYQEAQASVRASRHLVLVDPSFKYGVKDNTMKYQLLMPRKIIVAQITKYY